MMVAPHPAPINEVAEAEQAWIAAARAIGEHRRGCGECAPLTPCAAGAERWAEEANAWGHAESVRRAAL